MHSLAQGFASGVATYVVNALWQVPAIAGAGWAAACLLRGAGPRAQHRAWVSALLLSIVMPAVAIVGLAGWTGFPSPGAATVSMGAAAEGARFAARGSSLPLPGWLLWSGALLYAAVVLYFAGRLAWLVRQTRVLVAESVPAELPESLAMAWESCQRAFGVEAAVLRASERVRGVVTAGARVIVVPKGFLDWCTERECVSAMGHECAHIRRRDAAKNLLYEAASVLTAFHPMTWMMKARIAETREIVCDAEVVEMLVDARSYTQSLLRLAERMLTPGADPVHAIGMFDANVLEKRIMWMKTRKRSVGRVAGWAMTAGAALVLGAAAAGAASMGSSVEAQTATQGAGEVYQPGGDVTAPVLTYAPDPEFPKNEKKSRGGVCVLGLVVDAHGLPQGVHVERSLKADFDANALGVVRQYRFKPGMREGRPVAVRIHIEVNYRRY